MPVGARVILRAPALTVDDAWAWIRRAAAAVRGVAACPCVVGPWVCRVRMPRRDDGGFFTWAVSAFRSTGPPSGFRPPLHWSAVVAAHLLPSCRPANRGPASALTATGGLGRRRPARRRRTPDRLQGHQRRRAGQRHAHRAGRHPAKDVEWRRVSRRRPTPSRPRVWLAAGRRRVSHHRRAQAGLPHGISMIATGATAASTIRANERKIMEHIRMNARTQTMRVAKTVMTMAPAHWFPVVACPPIGLTIEAWPAISRATSATERVA